VLFRSQLQERLAQKKRQLVAELREKFEAEMTRHNLRFEDVFPEYCVTPADRPRRPGRMKVTYQYGNFTWAGRGKTPRWVQKVLEDRGISIREFKASQEFRAKS